MTKLDRRQFLKIAAAGLLAGCRSVTPTAVPSAAPTAAPTAKPTARPTNTPTPAPTPIPTARPEAIEMYPAAPSKVVQTRHAGVWSGDALEPAAIRQMLDASITELTGLNGAREAWAALFDPGERIAIKVNVFRNSLIWTHLPLVTAVTDALQEIGIPAEQIVIFDYYTSELEEAGYPVNQDGPGVRCYGTDVSYTKGWRVNDRDIELSNVLLDCDALINVPVLKSHMISGVSFALKNHYGSLSFPDALHSPIGPAMAELNALPPIKDRTRLIVGDVLEACLKYKSAFPYWKADWKGDAILMSLDPVAHDTVGLQLLSKLVSDSGSKPDRIISMATPCLESGAEWGLGTNDPASMNVVEVNLA